MKSNSSFNWIIGPQQSWRDHQLVQYLKENFSDLSDLPLVMLVPTKRRARFIQKIIKESFEDKIWSPQVQVLPEFVEDIYFQEIEPHCKKRGVSEIEKILILEECIFQLGGELEFFNQVLFQNDQPRFGNYRGILRQLGKLVSFLRENGFDHNLVERIVLDEFGNSGIKENDLTKIFNRYLQILDDFKLVDHEGKTLEVQTFIKEGGICNHFNGRSLLIIDSFSYLSRLEEGLLDELIGQSQSVILMVDFEGSPENLMEDLERGRDEIQRIKYRNILSIKTFLKKYMKGSSFDVTYNIDQSFEEKVHPLVSGLYSDRKLKKIDFSSTDKPNIVLYPLHNRVSEVRFICQRIKEYFQAGTSLSDIHVVFPQIENYLSIIYEIFPQYGIPFSVTRGLTLNSSPIAVIIQSMLKIPQGFSREDIFQFFSSNLVSFRQKIDESEFEEFIKKYKIGELSSVMNEEELVERFGEYAKIQKENGYESFHFDVQTLDRYARSANVRGGNSLLDDWFTPLDQIYFSTRYHSRLHQDEEVEKTKRVYLLILRQLYCLEKIFSIFSEIKNLKNPEKILSNIYKLINEFYIPKNIVTRIRNLPDLNTKDQMLLLRRDMSSLRMVFEALKDLKSVFQLRKTIRGEEKNDNHLDSVSRLLEEEIFQRFIQDPLDPNVVQITETLEVRGLQFKALFMGGLTSDEFPRRESEDFLIPENIDAKFRKRNSIDESIYLFDCILKNTSESIVMTYPKVEMNKELEGSSVLEDVLFCCPNIHQEPNFESNTLYSVSEIEFKLGSMIHPGMKNWPSEVGVLLDRFEENSGIVEKINMECERRSNQTLGSHDGIIRDFNFEEILGEKPVYSVSQLNRYATCPQEYFYARILNLEPLDELTEEMRADEFGSFLHEIFEVFYKSWVKAGHQNITDGNFSESITLMRQCAQDVLSANRKNLEYILWDQQTFKICSGLEDDYEENSAPKGLLRSFLENERAYSSQNFMPDKFEQTFGFENQRFQIGDVFIRGQIDRIDRIEQEDASGFFIIDYKTGRKVNAGLVKKGLNFQLPVYLYYLRSYLAQEQKDSDYFWGAGFYHVQDPFEIGISGFLLDPDLMGRKPYGIFPSQKNKSGKLLSEFFLDICTSWIQKIDSHIKNGVFNYAFEDLKCRFCDYKNICRRDPERIHFIESNSDEFYVPSKNQDEFLTVMNFLDLKNEIEKIIHKKSTQSKPRLGSKEEGIGNKFDASFQEMDSVWQGKLETSYRPIVTEWQNLVNKMGK